MLLEIGPVTRLGLFFLPDAVTGEKHFWSGRVNDRVSSPGLMILSLIISANYLPAFFFFLPCKISPWWLSGKESACQCRRPQFYPWVGKIPWRSEWLSTPVFLPGESYGQRGLAGYSLWGCRIGHDLVIKPTIRYSQVLGVI